MAILEFFKNLPRDMFPTEHFSLHCPLPLFKCSSHLTVRSIILKSWHGTKCCDRVDGFHCSLQLQTYLVCDHVLHGDLSADDVLVPEVLDGAAEPRLEERGRQREERPLPLPRVGGRVLLHAVVPRGQPAHVHVGGEVALSDGVPQGGRLR